MEKGERREKRDGEGGSSSFALQEENRSRRLCDRLQRVGWLGAGLAIDTSLVQLARRRAALPNALTPLRRFARDSSVVQQIYHAQIRAHNKSK